ncbi:MAG: cysteine desulfurase [Candidatus Pelagibacterales bacterium]
MINSNIKNDFPIFSKKILDKDLIYFDTAASAQKPQLVTDEISDFYNNHYSNVSRGVHTLSVESTFKYEDARKKIKDFINAKSENEIIFTKSATESINLVAQTFCEKYMQKGDEVILSIMEHHSNLVPWYFLRDKHGIILKFAKIDDEGKIDLDHFSSLINKKTKIASITHLSNVFGTSTTKEIVKICREKDIFIMFDGCQAAAHNQIDVQELDCDFYVFSGHKTYGPSGIGVLYGKERILNELPPYQGGGGMISEVTLENVSFADLPAKYEAGTPPLVEAYGLGVAIDYMNSVGIKNIFDHEKELSIYALSKMRDMEFVEIYGNGNDKSSIISFNLKQIHAHEVASFLDVEGIAIRAGHHCCQPLMKHLNVNATSRISFGIYNNIQEIDIFIEALNKCKEFFKK